MEQYEYDAFGKPYFYNAAGGSVASSEFGNRFLFTGREYLSDLKLYDYRNRMYQPELGRFMQPDPKHFAAGDYNLYRYCHNDPVNKADPLGLVPPGEGLMDVPRDMLKKMYDANKKNVENTETKPDLGARRERIKQEFRTTGFTNGKEEKPSSIKGYRERETQQPKAKLPADPFGGKGRPVWDTHSHVAGSGRPYGGDKSVADLLRVPLGVQSATDGATMYLYVPSEKGGRGGEFYTNDGRSLYNLQHQQVPH